MTNWIVYDVWTDGGDIQPFELEGTIVTMTCAACPEQYDIHLPTGEKIGYLRLRGGHFRADYPDCGEETVYEHHFDDMWQGCFSPEERQIHLPAAVKALMKRHLDAKAEES